MHWGWKARGGLSYNPFSIESRLNSFTAERDKDYKEEEDFIKKAEMEAKEKAMRKKKKLFKVQLNNHRVQSGSVFKRRKRKRRKRLRADPKTGPSKSKEKAGARQEGKYQGEQKINKQPSWISHSSEGGAKR